MSAKHLIERVMNGESPSKVLENSLDDLNKVRDWVTKQFYAKPSKIEKSLGSLNKNYSEFTVRLTSDDDKDDLATESKSYNLHTEVHDDIVVVRTK